MTRLNLDKDSKPVSEFRANAAELIAEIRSSGRPLVLTERGRWAAVVLDVGNYEEMVEELELLRDVRAAARQIDAGFGVSNEDAKARLRGLLDR